jgi:glycerol-3-phosphate O-acyltransferase
MPERELTRPYTPPAVLKILYRRFFDHIQVDEGWADQVRRLSERGTVLYVLRNLNWLDFLALDYLTKRQDLPPIRYVNDLGLWILNPAMGGPGRDFFGRLLPSRRAPVEEELVDAIEHGGSAALFLKRPPSVIDVAAGATGGRGMKEGDELVEALFRIQRRSERPLILLPIVFVWSKSPDQLGSRPMDLLLGPRHWPTPTRALGQFAYNFKHVTLRVAEPLELSDLLAANPGLSDEVLVRRMTYAVLRRLERERRAVVGPALKAPARVREEILRSPRLRSVVDDLAGNDPEARKSHTTKALTMLKELQARPDLTVIKGLEVALDWGFHKMYRGIEFDPADLEELRRISKSGTLILLPSHKSHIDYLILSYFFYVRNLPLPLIAAGDNLNFMPMGPIFRRGGAFFIRRSFKGDRLYAAVVDAYIRRLIRDGFPIELFLEGGRSRTGKLLAPKFGLLNMIVDAALSVPQQQVYFVPVSIGYERVIEADSYQREVSGGEKKKEEAADLLNATEALRHRYGRINVQVSPALTLDDICQELGINRDQLHRPAKRRAVVTRLGNRVMDEINRVTAVTPGALVAMALLSHSRRGMAEPEVLARTERLLGLLQRMGARVTTATILPGGDLRHASIREALQMFADAEMLDVAKGTFTENGHTRETLIYSVVESRRIQLDTSKNIIVHFFVERGLVACALDHGTAGTPIDVVRERVLWISRLFKHEFRFRADAPFSDIFDDTLATLVQDGHLTRVEDRVEAGPGSAGWDGATWLATYASILRNFVEGYAVAARSLHALLNEPIGERDLVKQALSVGHQMYLDGAIERRESISKPILSNAYHAFLELGYLKSREGKWEITETFASRESLLEIERAILGSVTGKHDAKP